MGNLGADFGGLANHHPHPMIDKEIRADLRPRVNLNPGQSAHKLGKPARR